MTEEKKVIATNRNEKGFFVQSIDISSIPARSDNEFERHQQFLEAVEDYKKLFKDEAKKPQHQENALLGI